MKKAKANVIDAGFGGYAVHGRSHRRGGLERARRLVAVDIENLVGGACLHRRQVDWARSALTGALSLAEHDLVVVGLSHIGLLNVGCNWKRIRYVVRSGPDGADLALLDVLAEDIGARFDRVVIASGDGAFTDAAKALVRAGVETTVLSRPGALASSLRAAASQVLYIPEPPADADMNSAGPTVHTRPAGRVASGALDWNIESRTARTQYMRRRANPCPSRRVPRGESRTQSAPLRRRSVAA